MKSRNLFPSLLLLITACGPSNNDTTKDATPETFTPASIISDFQLVEDDSCCFDINGDGKNNNGLGALLKITALFGITIEGVNTSIAESIDNGQAVILMEYEGLDETSTNFAINYHIGTPSGGFTTPVAAGANAYTLDAATSTAKMETTTLTGDALSTEPGTMKISTTLLGPPVTLPISAAQITADIDRSRTDLSNGQGVALVNGKLSGAVKIEDVFNIVNDLYAQECGCAPIEGGKPLISFQANMLDEATCTNAMNDTSACDMNSSTESLCISIYDICDYVGSIKSVADVNVDNIMSDCNEDDSCNAISLAATFEADGAKIVGQTP